MNLFGFVQTSESFDPGIPGLRKRCEVFWLNLPLFFAYLSVQEVLLALRVTAS
jgi:hypothetical protein